MMGFYLVVLLCLGLACGLPLDDDPTTPAPFTTCEYKGSHYSLGQQWQDGPCDNCYCMSTSGNVSICRQNCPKFTFVPDSCHLVVPQGKCCQEVSCEVSRKCVFKGTYYSQGEKWQDGCTSTCTCVNGSTGLVSCQARCPTFTQIPTGCHVVPPPAGSTECCSSIHCGDTIVG